MHHLSSTILTNHMVPRDFKLPEWCPMTCNVMKAAPSLSLEQSRMLLASILRQPSVNAVSRQNLDIFPCVTDPSLETFSCPSPHVFKSMKPWPGIIPLFPPSALVLWRFYKRGLSVLDQHTGTAHNRLNISFHLGKKKNNTWSYLHNLFFPLYFHLWSVYVGTQNHQW